MDRAKKGYRQNRQSSALGDHQVKIYQHYLHGSTLSLAPQAYAKIDLSTLSAISDALIDSSSICNSGVAWVSLVAGP
jgi:hypothetical protein